ncbi:MAG: non-homologous end-joining DNA ligase [Acidimicrobiia bacterium]
MVEVTNPTKVIFPEAGLTKADLVGHYRQVAERMVPQVAGRPLTLQRFPNGVGESGFMQKNASEYFPEFIERITVRKSEGTVTHPVVRDPEGLAYLANQATVTFHVWTSTVDDLMRPNRVIFDLDPPEGDVDAARFAARAVGEQLDVLGLAAFPMTTGSKGYHVVAPLLPQVEIWKVDEFSQGFAALLAARHPNRLTLEFRKRERRGRVFLDWLRNRYSATSVAPWSLRPRPDAPVSVPISWDELDEMAPDHWKLPGVFKRLAQPDPWQGLEEAAVDLRPAAEAVAELVAEAGITLETFDRFRS